MWSFIVLQMKPNRFHTLKISKYHQLQFEASFKGKGKQAKLVKTPVLKICSKALPLKKVSYLCK